MNKEIKFEYIIETGKGIVKEVFTLEDLEEGKFSLINYSLPRKVIAKRQYTGIKDKNSVDIYKGDVAEVMFISTSCNAKDRRFKKYVEFENGSFSLFFPNENHWVCLSNLCNTDIEIIGNIYENPELLKASYVK